MRALQGGRSSWFYTLTQVKLKSGALAEADTKGFDTEQSLVLAVLHPWEWSSPRADHPGWQPAAWQGLGEGSRSIMARSSSV